MCCTICRRVLVTTGLLTCYLAACLIALERLVTLWSPSL